jgi:uncharacterized protein (TIGR03790 family)
MTVRSILSFIVVSLLLVVAIPMENEENMDLSGKQAVEFAIPDTGTISTRSGLYNGLISYDDVAVIINIQSLISQDIGDYFIQQRGIPAQNVIYVNITPVETINRATFNTLRAQIEENITSRGLTDKINYMVTTKGVPLRVSGSGNCAVDSELALILGPYSGNMGSGGWMDSPYYNSDEPISHAKHGIYVVTRLTGYTVEEAKNLVNLSSASYRSTGLFAFDAGGPYASGDNWISFANQTMSDKGYTTSYDDTSVFQMNYKDVIGYCSWGSNGQGYGSNFVSNNGFEVDTSPLDGIPDGWTVEYDVGSVAQSADTSQSGTYSVKIDRPSVTTGTSIIGRNITITPGARYWATGYANLSGVAGGKGAHLFIRAYDSGDNLLAQYNGSTRTGTRLWYSMGQAHYEPPASVAYVMVGAALSEASGVAYFDGLTLRVIKPNNTWVPGGIGETFVSTGGRSFTYGTSYGQSLVADTVREGISGISGHVYEPFLSACGRPYILFDTYTNGYNMGESFYQALPFLSWMEVVVGDPKMAPFFDNRVDLFAQSAWLDNDTVIAGDLLNYHSLVKRTGYLWDQGMNVSIHLSNGTSGPIMTTDATLYMENMETEWMNTSFDTSMLVGDYNLTMEIDALGQIREKFEDNNTVTIPFTVVTQPTILDVAFSKEKVLRGGSVDVSVRVVDLTTPYDQLNFSCRHKNIDTAWTGLSMTPQATNGLWSGTFQTDYDFPLGPYSFEFNITNQQGLTTSRTELSAVEVMNNLPWIGGLTVEPTQNPRDQSAIVTVFPEDLEDEEYNMSVKLWHSSDNSSWSVISGMKYSGNGYEGEISFTKNSNLGPIYLKATTTDQDGNTSEPYYAPGWLELVNSLPSVETLQVSPNLVYRGDSVLIRVNATDFETPVELLNITLEYRIAKSSIWLPAGNPEYTEVSGDFVKYMLVGKDFELTTLSFRARTLDSEGGVSQWSYLNDSVKVKNRLPEVESLSVDRGNLYRGESLNITLKCSDYEDELDELTPEVQYKVSDGNWNDVEGLQVSGDTHKVLLKVPTTVPVGNMTFRAQVYDLDTVQYENLYWKYFDDVEVQVMNNPPRITSLSAPATVNGTLYVDYAVVVEASDVEDETLNVTLQWSLDGKEDVVVLTKDGVGSYKGVLRIDVPQREGTFYIDYKVEATDADGGKALRTYTEVTKVEKDDGQGPDKPDDDTSGVGAMMWWLIPLIIILLIIIAVVIFVVYRKRRWPDREQPPSMPPQEEKPIHPPPAVHEKPVPPKKKAEKPVVMGEKPKSGKEDVDWEDEEDEDEPALEESPDEEPGAGEGGEAEPADGPGGEDMGGGPEELEELEELETTPELEALPEDDELDELDDLLMFDEDD